MNRPTLPRALFAILVAALAAPAAALPPSTPMRPEPVDDATLAQVSGKYYGANMLVGLRVDLVSSLQSAAGTSTARGTLSMQRVNGQFVVQVDTHANAHASGDATTSAPAHTARGGETVRTDGIAQVAQVAGDGNSLLNLTTISFVPATTPLENANGRSDSAARDGAVTARITFTDGGASVALGAPGANLAQQFGGSGGNDGRIAQLGQLAGNGFSASNQLHLQLTTQAMSPQMLQQLGVLQALSGLNQLNR